MPVVGVLAHADIGDDDELGQCRLQRADALLDDAVVAVGFATRLVLVLGDAEEHDGEDAEAVEFRALLHQFVHREAVLPRHGGDLLTDARAMNDEEGRDEVGGAERRLTDEAAQLRGHTHTA